MLIREAAQAVNIALCCPPALDGEPTEVTAHGGCRTQRNQAGGKLGVSTLLAGFHCARRRYGDCWGGGSSTVTPSCDTTPACLAGCAHWCHSGTALLGSPTDFWLDLKPAPRMDSCLILQTWAEAHGEVHREESFTALWLSGHGIKLPSKCVIPIGQCGFRRGQRSGWLW